jgi:hypothetical protein
MRLTEQFEARIHTLQIKLEGNQTPEETAQYRGRIAELRNILTYSKDLPPQT